MKSSYLARLRRSKNLRGNLPPSFSLFPFLAVLISTMGILILLIIVIVRQSRRVASQQAAAQQEEVQKELKSNLELLDWEAEVLAQALEAGQEKIQSLRGILGHLEDHTRRLMKRREEILALMRSQQEPVSGGIAPEKIRDELTRLEEQIRLLRAEVEELSRRAERKRRYYSIVPYGGPFGTSRRPIYLECRQDAIILQPEGITFLPEDFEGDLGPGNPLDTALRAIREYRVRHGLAAEEPYPLFVVRPGGISAYYVARAALEPWGGEFGYELVEEDWEILYPQPDLAMAREVTAAVELARARTRALGRMASRRWANAPRRFIVAPDGGGLIAESGQPLQKTFPPYPGGNRDHPGISDSSRNKPEEERGNFASSGGRNFQAGDVLSSSARRGRQSFSSDASTETWPGGSGNQSGKASLSAGKGAAAGAEPRLGDQNSFLPTESFIPGIIPGVAGGLGSGREEPLGETSEGESPGRSLRSLATIRGANWALPPGSQVLVPIWRPVRILCTEEYVVLEPEAGLGPPKFIRWQDPPEKTVDELVRAVWEYVDGWGPAGRGMAWRPQLKVRVASDGEYQAKLLLELLEGSGLPVEIVR